MTTYDDRLAFVREEIATHIPDDVQAALAAASFAPVLDAGNLWFYDRGSLRLAFGEDGSDYPDSLDYPCVLVDMTKELGDPDYERDGGPLCKVLERFTGKHATGLPAVGDWLVVRDFLGSYPIPPLPAGTRVEVMEHVTGEGDAYLSVSPAYGQPGVTDAMFDAMSEWDGCWYVYTPDDGRSLASEVWARLRRVEG
jgi:hypothetical protein